MIQLAVVAKVCQRAESASASMTNTGMIAKAATRTTH
jgi:hypothetical protein